ncbi:MAG: hypothetical protein M1815_000078 [Lichina confinis]|nr:MAG: hypothetical protein M1815_000078 [Lichina confinis]
MVAPRNVGSKAKRAPRGPKPVSIEWYPLDQDWWLDGQARSLLQVAPGQSIDQDQSASSGTEQLSVERYAVDRGRAADAADEEEFPMDAIQGDDLRPCYTDANTNTGRRQG